MFATPRSGRSPRGFTLIELMIVVAILGILAVVAIPAFVRYMRIAKTAEVYRSFGKMFKGAAQYFMSPKFDENGSRLACQFPMGSDGWPGAYNCCNDGEPDGKCEPNEDRWSNAFGHHWQTILFKISDKHYYEYGHGSDDTAIGPRTRHYLVAKGDLDCDGTYSTFMQMIDGSYPAGSGGIVNCTVLQRQVIVINETE